MKLYTFDARQTKARVSASVAGDHINLSPKLRAAKDRNGKVALLAFSNAVAICTLGWTAASPMLPWATYAHGLGKRKKRVKR